MILTASQTKQLEPEPEAPWTQWLSSMVSDVSPGETVCGKGGTDMVPPVGGTRQVPKHTHMLVVMVMRATPGRGWQMMEGWAVGWLAVWDCGRAGLAQADEITCSGCPPEFMCETHLQTGFRLIKTHCRWSSFRRSKSTATVHYSSTLDSQRAGRGRSWPCTELLEPMVLVRAASVWFCLPLTIMEMDCGIDPNCSWAAWDGGVSRSDPDLTPLTYKCWLCKWPSL